MPRSDAPEDLDREPGSRTWIENLDLRSMLGSGIGWCAGNTPGKRFNILDLAVSTYQD
jgi:hypothetical protein